MAVWPFVILAAPIAAGAVAFARDLVTNPNNRRWRALRKLEFTRVADLEVGSVAKVRGRVEAFGAPLDLPLTDRKCVHYQVLGLIYDEVSGTYDHRQIEKRSVDFWLVDETGRLLVRDGSFHRILAREQLVVAEGRHATREALKARFGEEVREGVVASLDVGEEIVVLGRIGIEKVTDGPGGYRDARGSHPALIEDPGVERLVSDFTTLVAGAAVGLVDPRSET